MQRVLSFQMARGFGESSEFVTKRMCFSLLFSVGFLSLLCGFLLGRFAAERTIAFRAVKKQLELAGNGLDSTEDLRLLALREFDELDPDSDLFTAESGTLGLRDEDRRRINGVMTNLSFIPLVTERASFITATIRGHRESDRYVVVSASDKGIAIALQFLKVMSKIYREHEWKPRRTLLFCLFSGKEPADPCTAIFPHSTQRKIVGYIALHGHSWSGRREIKVDATEISLAVVSEAILTISNLVTDRASLPLPRRSASTLDLPHVIFSLREENRTYWPNVESNGATMTILAQIVAETIWRLSESLVLKWNPHDFNRTGLKVLGSFNQTEFHDVKESSRDVLERLVTSVQILNQRIDSIDSTRIMEQRIVADTFMDLDRALMCPDSQLEERLNWEGLGQLRNQPPAKISVYFNEMILCYQSAIDVLYDA